MTNAQLFFSAGFPTLVIVIGFVWQGSRFSDRFDALQKQMDVRFEGVNQRFEGVNQRFESINEQLAQMNAKIGVIEGDLRQFYRDLGKHEKAIERLEAGTK